MIFYAGIHDTQYLYLFYTLSGRTQSIYTKGSRRNLKGKKTIAHDDVTHGAIVYKILKKIIDLATRIELTLSILMP